MLFLVFILFFFGNIFCNSLLIPTAVNIIPAQRLGINDSIFINLNSYIHAKEIDISFKFDPEEIFDLFLNGDSLRIKCIKKFEGYSSLDLTVNGKNINLMLASPIKNHQNLRTLLLKDSFESREDYLILNYKSVSKTHLRLNKFWILFNNQIIDSKYYHIFRNSIRVMLPKSLGDGVLRIFSTDKDGTFIQENHSIISNGVPLSPLSHSNSPYFTNIYHLIIDRFNDANPRNSIHEDDYSIDKKFRFHGGDFKGIEEKIHNSYFDKLEVGGILISPICLNQDSAYRSSTIPYKKYMSFDGSMPIDSKEIDHRYGDANDFKALVKEGHSHGIEFYIDYINTYTDKNHSYYINNPEWYTINDSLLSNFSIRQLDYTNSDLIKQISSDIFFLIKEYDLDGYSIKGNPHINKLKKHIHNFHSSIEDKSILQIIKSETRLPPVNGVRNKNVFNSSYNIELYKAGREHFSSRNIDFIKLNNLIRRNLDYYKPINSMITSTSIPNQERFMSLVEKPSSESILNKVSYERLFMFMLMNYSMPGIPSIFYGDEFGQKGKIGVDSNRDMKFHKALTKLEANLKLKISILNKIRKSYPSLSIGDFMVLREGLDYSVWLKSYFNEQLLILFNAGDKYKELNISLPFSVRSLTSLLDENHLKSEGSDVLNIVIPPHTSRVYLLN